MREASGSRRSRCSCAPSLLYFSAVPLLSWATAKLTQASGEGSHDAAVGAELLDADDSMTGTEQILGDSAYGTGDMVTKLEASDHTNAVKLWPIRRNVPDGFTTDDFTVDHDARTVTCPAGNTSGSPPRSEPQCSGNCAPTARWQRCAPTHLKVTSSSLGSTTSCSGPTANAGPPISRCAPTTAGTAPWSNDPSPG
jgi:hypothetical protein